jgi:intracellular septation protein A
MEINLIWAAVIGVIPASAADWLFADFLIRKRYQLTPDTWRSGGERRRIAAAQLLALVTSAAFVLLAWKLHQTDRVGALKLAAMVWLIGPLPLLLGNMLFIRIDPLVTASHAAAWLIKLVGIAAVTAWLVQ